MCCVSFVFDAQQRVYLVFWALLWLSDEDVQGWGVFGAGSTRCREIWFLKLAAKVSCAKPAKVPGQGGPYSLAAGLVQSSAAVPFVTSVSFACE